VVAVLIAVVATAVPMLSRFWTNASGPSPAVSVSPTLSVAPGRVLLKVQQNIPLWAPGQLPVIPAVNVDTSLSLVPKPPGFSKALQQVATPDGRIVVIGTVAHATTLAVLASDGTVITTRRVSEADLSAATNTDVFLIRMGGVFVAHNIATGAEREVRRYDPDSMPSVMVADANADTVVVAPADLGNTSCSAALLDPRTGRQIRVITAPVPMCSPFDIRLSPDGRYLAMRVPIPNTTSSGTRLFIMDVATGRAVRDFPAPVKKGPATGLWFTGWGWSGPNTVRVVSGQRPTEDITGLAKALQIDTFTV
jgi:hypothetical protein